MVVFRLLTYYSSYTCNYYWLMTKSNGKVGLKAGQKHEAEQEIKSYIENTRDHGLECSIKGNCKP